MLTIAQRQAKRGEPKDGRVGYIGIDVVEDEVSNDFDPSSVPTPVILQRVPQLLLHLCQAMLRDDRLLRVEVGRQAKVEGAWPRVLRSEADLPQIRVLWGAAVSADDALYPISVWAIPVDGAVETEGLVDSFKQDPANSQLLAEVHGRNTVRISVFASSVSLSMPPLLLEKVEEWLRSAAAGLPLPVIWQE